MGNESVTSNSEDRLNNKLSQYCKGRQYDEGNTLEYVRKKQNTANEVSATQYALLRN